MNVVAVAGDAGGARAVLPVIRELARRGNVRCRPYGAAVEVWRRAGLATEDVAPMRLGGADALLVGTSLGPEPWEPRYVAAAKEAGVRSVAVLDAWVNYGPRFDLHCVRILPDAIAVMDDAARGAMLAEGFPPGILHATGHPGLEALKAFDAPESRRSAAKRLRENVGCGPDEVCALFVSQPLSQLWTVEKMGFHEAAATRELAQAFARALAARDKRGVLAVKSHPREAAQPAPLPGPLDACLRPVRLGDLDLAPAELATGADVVLGLSSMLLFEAALLGVPVASYQPGLRIADPLPSNALGWSHAAFEPAALGPALDRLLDAPRDEVSRRSLAAARLPQGATARVLELISPGA